MVGSDGSSAARPCSSRSRARFSAATAVAAQAASESKLLADGSGALFFPFDNGVVDICRICQV